MGNVIPDTSALVRKRDTLNNLIDRVGMISNIMTEPKSLDYLIECILQTGPVGPSDACAIALCFGHDDSTEVKFAVYRANSSGKARFNLHWELELVS